MTQNTSASKSALTTKSLVYCALLTALMAASAWISIPLGPVPFTMQTFVMTFGLLILKPREFLFSVALYLLLGALGLPVFSGMRGGFAMLLGPTGGFLWGFFVAALLSYGARAALGSAAQKLPLVVIDSAVATLYTILIFACGVFQLMIVANLDFAAALAAGVIPFIFTGILKLAGAVILVQALRKTLAKLMY